MFQIGLANIISTLIVEEDEEPHMYSGNLQLSTFLQSDTSEAPIELTIS